MDLVTEGEISEAQYTRAVGWIDRHLRGLRSVELFLKGASPETIRAYRIQMILAMMKGLPHDVRISRD